MKQKTKSTRVLTLLARVVPSLVLITGVSAAGDDQPTIAKDSVQATAFTLNVFNKDYDKWSWVPKISFRVNGPIASGGQLYATFTIPGSKAPVQFDCPTSETQKGRWLNADCGARDVPEEKGSTYTGPVSFAIRMRNELTSTDAVLFTGKMKVAKAHSNEVGPKATNKFVFYVDQDWNMPIGYAFLTADELKGWDYPIFNVAFWFRGDPGVLEPHIFFQGKEVGKIFYQGREVGGASCTPEVELGTALSVDDSLPQKAKWARVSCSFNNVRGVDKTGQGPGMFGPSFIMGKNPGEYEVKVLQKNHLARSVKVTVGADGKFDNGIATANKLGNNRSIVPVKIIGDQDGQWNHTAWKTDSFYGNPITGFTALP